MAKRSRKLKRLPEDGPAALGELIHAQVRVAIASAQASAQERVEEVHSEGEVQVTS